MKLRGSLETKDGKVADGLYDLTFTAYDALDGKVVLGTESQSVTVVGGVFTVLLWEPPEKPPDVGKGRAYLDVLVGKVRSSRVEVETDLSSRLSPFDPVRPTKSFLVDSPISPLQDLANKGGEKGGSIVFGASLSTGLMPVSARVVERLVFVGAYRTVEDGRPSCQLEIFDVGDPLAPGLVASIPLAVERTGVAPFPDRVPWPYSIEVELPYVYALSGYASEPYTAALQVIDVSTPAAPVLRGTLDPVTLEWPSMAVRDSYVYVAGQFGIDVIDARDPAVPRTVRVSEVEVDGEIVLDVTVCGAYLCAFHHRDVVTNQLKVYSLDDPASPRFVAAVDAPSNPTRLTADDHCVYLTAAGDFAGNLHSPGGGIWTLEIPVPAGVAAMTGTASTADTWNYAAAISNGYLSTLGDGGNIFEVFDVRDPTQPRSIGWFDFVAGDSGVAGLAMSGNSAYATLQHARTLYLVDLTPAIR